VPQVETGLLVAIAVVAVGVLTLIALLSPRQVGAAMVAALALPLFVDASTGQPTLVRLLDGQVHQTVTGIHVATAVVAVIAAVAMMQHLGRREKRVGGALVGALMVLYTASIVVGTLSGAGSLGVLYYAQTMAPLLAWVALARTGVEPTAVSRGVVLAVTATLLAILGTVGLGGGYQSPLAAVDVLASAIPQYRNYFPFVVMCAIAFAIAGWASHRKTSVWLLASTVAALPLMWSRTGLLMIAVAAALTYFRRPGKATATTRLMLGVLLTAGAGYYLTTRVLQGVLGARTTQALEASDQTRLRVAQEAIDRIAASPLLGDMFVPSTRYTAGGQSAAQPLLFPAHNQYLDIALRGGIAAAIVTVILLMLFFWRAWRLSAGSGPVASYHAALCGIIAAAAVGCTTQLYIVQPWTGSLLFALLAISSQLQEDVDDVGVGKSAAARESRVGSGAFSMSQPEVDSDAPRSR